MLELPVVVVEAEQERTDRGTLPALVPPKACDDAVAVALVLDLQHRAFVGFVQPRLLLGHDAVETRTLEAAKPVGGHGTIARRGRQMQGRRRRPASTDSRADRRSANGAPRRSTSPSASRSKNTIDAGICCGEHFHP